MKKESVDEMPDDNEAENVPDDNQNESPQYVDEHDTEDDEVKPTTDAARDPEEYDGDTRRSRKKKVFYKLKI